MYGTKKLGLANKTVMVVPKALINQTASEFLRLYPSANILVTTERVLKRVGDNSLYQELQREIMIA